MLVLSRRYGEELVVRFGDQEVSIVVHNRSGGQVKVEIDAPDEVEVVRGELLLDPEAG